MTPNLEIFLIGLPADPRREKGESPHDTIYSSLLVESKEARPASMKPIYLEHNVSIPCFPLLLLVDCCCRRVVTPTHLPNAAYSSTFQQPDKTLQPTAFSQQNASCLRVSRPQRASTRSFSTRQHRPGSTRSDEPSSRFHFNVERSANGADRGGGRGGGVVC